ncbi:GspH/FimT family pseudopilin [Thiocystis violascens]|nr:GspH/FimT family pseudopilin [Thiocystis violascens]
MNGVTLIELIVTLSIAAILLAIGVPSFQSVITSNRLVTSANDVLLGMHMAKSEAIRQNTSIRFCLNPTSREWRVATSAGTDIKVGSLHSTIAVTAANLDTSITNHVCVRFRSDGLSYDLGNTLMTNGSITLTLSGSTRAINVKTGGLHVTSS